MFKRINVCVQFQEQLDRGCSPEEADTFQVQGTDSKVILPQKAPDVWLFLCVSLSRVRDSWPDAAVPRTSPKADAAAGGEREPQWFTYVLRRLKLKRPVSSGLPGRGRSVGHVSSGGGVSHSGQSGGDAGETTDGRWDTWERFSSSMYITSEPFTY